MSDCRNTAAHLLAIVLQRRILRLDNGAPDQSPGKNLLIYAVS